MKYKDFIIEGLTDASKIADSYYGKVEHSVKPEDNNQVLTQADIEVGNFLVSQVKKQYPGHNIIDEEAGVIDNNSQFTWVIDPIDGTSNFAHGIPLYGILLGLLDRNTPIAGGAALPFFKDYYYAEKGLGSCCNDQKILVTSEQNLLRTLVSYGIDGHQEKPQLTYDETALLGDIVLGIRNLRTNGSTFDPVMVASGKYGGLLCRTSKIWDNVATQIILEEAGGLYTDFWGNPMDYSNPLTKEKSNFTICAASPILHQQLQTIIHNKKRGEI
jgi:myo-inositol-1(or 4)-monophosphatase